MRYWRIARAVRARLLHEALGLRMTSYDYPEPAACYVYRLMDAHRNVTRQVAALAVA